MKTLIVVSHPTIEHSKANRRWIEELKKYPEQFTVHHLEAHYPDGIIDIQREQQLIEAHDSMVLQFPIYWFNCPPLMKKWLDEVFLSGWAYGFKGEKLVGYNVGLAVTTGIKEADYRAEGSVKHTLEEVLVPFDITFHYMNAAYKGFYGFYGLETNASDEFIETSIEDYISFVRSIK